jgi:hypothetical protein
VLVFYPAIRTSNQADPIITPDETPGPHFPDSPSPIEPVCRDGDTRDATCSDGVTTYLDENCVDGEWRQVMYIRNPCEPLPTSTTLEEIYHDVTSGGTYDVGDYISYLGVKGNITTGKIIDGKSTSSLIIKDKEGKTILNYQPRDTPTLGHVEMISYPQEGKVDIKINDDYVEGCEFKYDPRYTFNDYLELCKNLNNISDSVKEKVLF